jgi:hypothetical protein
VAKDGEKGTSKAPELARGAPAAFSSPPPNAWGRVAETKERIGGKEREDLNCNDGGASLGHPRDPDQQEAMVEGSGVEKGLGVGEGDPVIGLETARAAFEGLAVGIQSFKDQVILEQVGFENPGSVCFANSVIQALLGCQLFQRFLYRLRTAREVLDEKSEDFPVLKALSEIGVELDWRRTGGLLPSEGHAPGKNAGRRPPTIDVRLINRLVHESFSTRYKGEEKTRQIEQEDAHEFLHCLLDGMHKELLLVATDRACSPAGVNVKADHFGRSVVDDRFAQSFESEEGWLTQSGKKSC